MRGVMGDGDRTMTRRFDERRDLVLLVLRNCLLGGTGFGDDDDDGGVSLFFAVGAAPLLLCCCGRGESPLLFSFLVFSFLPSLLLRC